MNFFKKKTSKFEVGKLYVCNRYNLILYPTIGLAKRTRGRRGSSKATTAAGAIYWSEHWAKRFEQKVVFGKRNEIFLVTKKDTEAPPKKKYLSGLLYSFLFPKKNKKIYYLHVIYRDKQGWIVVDDVGDIKIQNG